MLRYLLLALLLAAPSRAEEMVSTRPVSTIDDAAIHLGDVFEGAGARAGQSIGAAPQPGRRLILDAPQLLLLARSYGIAWRPLTPNDRVVIERAGRAVPREEIEAVLAAELGRLGTPQEAVIELGPWTPPMVPPSVPIELAAEAVSVDAVGRFSATLVIAAPGMPTQRLRVAGRAIPTLPVIVASHRLGMGEVVGPGDLRATRIRAERVRPGTAERPEQVVGLQLKRPIGAELPFQISDLAPPSMVLKNALVTLVLDAPGLALTAQGRALENAPRGAMVSVMNLASQSVLEGQVIAPGRVRIAMGSIPRSR